MMTRILFIFFFAGAALQAAAQPALWWGQRYNGPPDNADEALSIAVDAAGNSYVTGSGFNAAGNLDIVTIKYSPTGQQLWLQSFDGTGADNDEGRQVVVDNAGNIYVVGYSRSLTTGTDITTIKYSSNGVQQWAQLYDGASNNYDQGYSIKVDAGGNVYVCGYETVLPSYTYDFVTIKYNSAGVQQWAQTYDGPGQFNDEAKDIALDASGNVYVCGPSDTMISSTPNTDIVLLKYNNSGALQWRRVYDNNYGYEYAKFLEVDGNNDIVVIGYGFITGNGNDYFLLKWDAAGNFQWYENYNRGANTFEEPHGMVIDSLDNIIVTGQGISSTASGTNDYCTVKYSPAGVFQWAAHYNNINNGEDRAYGIAMDDSLCVYVTGFSKGTGTEFDIATVKYNAAGAQQYVLRFDNTSANLDDAGNAIACRNGNIWVTGRSANLGNNDYITLCYNYAAVGIAEGTQGAATLDVFPNPSSGDEVRVVLPAGFSQQAYTYTISNMLGQPVKQDAAQPAEHLLQVNIAGLAPGTYFISIRGERQTAGVARLVVR